MTRSVLKIGRFGPFYELPKFRPKFQIDKIMTGVKLPKLAEIPS